VTSITHGSQTKVGPQTIDQHQVPVAHGPAGDPPLGPKVDGVPILGFELGVHLF